MWDLWRQSRCCRYLWVSYGCHIIVQFIRVEGDGGQAVDVGVWLRVSPLHQAEETTVAKTACRFSLAGVHWAVEVGGARLTIRMSLQPRRCWRSCRRRRSRRSAPQDPSCSRSATAADLASGPYLRTFWPEEGEQKRGKGNEHPVVLSTENNGLHVFWWCV